MSERRVVTGGQRGCSAQHMHGVLISAAALRNSILCVHVGLPRGSGGTGWQPAGQHRNLLEIGGDGGMGERQVQRVHPKKKGCDVCLQFGAVEKLK